jgi:hypothetical protein
MKDYMEDLGIETALPDGKYSCLVMKGNGHPCGKINDKTGLPEMFFLGRVTKGEREGRTQPITLRWFASKEDKDGNPRPEAKVNSAQGFARKNTIDALIALYGDAPTTGDMIRTRFPKTADTEAVKSSFDAVAGEIEGFAFELVLSTKGDFQNVALKPATLSDEFSA